MPLLPQDDCALDLNISPACSPDYLGPGYATRAPHARDDAALHMCVHSGCPTRFA